MFQELGLDPTAHASDKAAIDAVFQDLSAAGVLSTDGSLRVPLADFLRMMQAQRFFQGDPNRHWVALSLREAESMRGCLHLCSDLQTSLVPGHRVSVALRSKDLLLTSLGASNLDGSSAAYDPPPRQQLLAAVQAYRFIDSQLSFNDADVRLLLRMLRASSTDERRRWFVDVMACRRRPQGALSRLKGKGVGVVLSTEDEYHLLVQSATLWRLARELKAKALGVHDIFHAFNGRRDGLMSCGELAAGMAWLGLPMGEGELHAFVRGLDKDSDGLVSLEEWAQGFPQLPESHAATQESLAALTLKPKPVRELYEGAPAIAKAALPVPAATLAKFKFKLKVAKGYLCVWSNKATGAQSELSIWGSEVDSGSLLKKSSVRVCFGHLIVQGHEPPDKASKAAKTAEPMILEVTDTSVSHALSSSEFLGAVIDQLLPHPLRWRLAWQEPHWKPPLYIWRAVPPGGQFVSLGMVATTNDEPPPLSAIRCMPRRWCQYETDAPKGIWSSSGQGARLGSFWMSGVQLGTLLAMQTQEEPSNEMRMKLHSERWFARPEKLSDLVALAKEEEPEVGRVNPRGEASEKSRTSSSWNPFSRPRSSAVSRTKVRARAMAHRS